ncbi:MAG: phosphate acetyltransferase, partial [Eggerthellaceae bacterium]|nr:phosphate acetyltransferase [Eggerthellaceae bacterium]
MSSFIDSMFTRAKSDRKKIVLPEGDDERTLAAAESLLREGVADLVILGNGDAIASSGYALEGAQIVDMGSSGDKQRYADAFYELRKAKGMTPEGALEKMDEVLYFGAMMVKLGEADGMVAGACHSTSDTLRAALQILKTAPGVKSVSSFFVMVVPDCEYGENGTFIFSDCGLNIQPDADMLAELAVNSAKSWQILVGSEPRVAMLSHSTFGSAAANDDRDKVASAVQMARQAAPELKVDGE